MTAVVLIYAYSYYLAEDVQREKRKRLTITRFRIIFLPMKNITEMTHGLLREKFTPTSLAREIGTSQPQVCRIRDGQIPNYELGKSIELLHRSLLEEKESAA